jgi:hypothetical protein
MKTGPWGLNSKTSKNLSKVANLRNLNFKILSMKCIKLAHKTLSRNFTFLAIKAKAVGVTQILCTTAATTRDREIFLSLKSC